MREESPRIAKAYKRAAIGLAVATVFWSVALVLVERYESEKPKPYAWLIPIGAGILSAFYSLLYFNAKKPEE